MTEDDKRVAKALEKPGTYNWEQTPLVKAIEEIRKSNPDLKIVLSKEALDKLSKSRDMVDLSVKHMKMWFILKLLLPDL